MLTAQREELPAACLLPDQPQRVIANAAQLLSNLSNFVGVVTTPRRSSVFRHIEFLRLSDRRVLVIIVSPDGDVQNRVIFTETDYTQTQLVEATNYLNQHYAGVAIEQVREHLSQEVEQLRTEIADLMRAAVQAGTGAFKQEEDDVVISGERKLLAVTDFASDMSQLRRAFELFEQKAQLMRLMDNSSKAQGVRIYIGGESQIVPFEELSRGQRAVRSRRPGRRHARRGRPDPHAVRPHDPDRGHHVAADQQCVEPSPVMTRPRLRQSHQAGR